MHKRLVVDALSRDALLGVADRLGFELPARTPAVEVRERLVRSRTSADEIVEVLLVSDLQRLCRTFELRAQGTKDELQERLRVWMDEGGQVESDEDDSEEDAEEQAHFLDEAYAEAFWRECSFSDRHATPARPYQEAAVRALRSGLSDRVPGLLHVATGGGKTRIANDFVVGELEEKGGWVLWVTKDWRLLHQAARDVARRHPGMSERLSRLGGSGTSVDPLPEGIAERGIAYTTLQTLARRLEELAAVWAPPTVVVWDECHWGGTSKMGRRLRRACREHGLRLLGLTATPRQGEESGFQILYRIGFPELVAQGYLARPRLHEPVATEVQWAPARSGQFSDVTQASLRELAESNSRNQLIVRHYDAQHRRYGKTIVFACNTAHAERLARLFNQKGHPARPVHSGRSEGENAAAIELFRRGQINVLVNVGMLTTGFDVPDARTVFLCRPTFSDILFAQMVGRASRLDQESGKTHFEVVEFSDNLERFGGDLVRGKDVFGSGFEADRDRTRRSSGPRAPQVRSHGFDPHGKPLWLPTGAEIDPALRGLWVRQGQTFGVEFELTRDDFDSGLSKKRWLETAEPLREALERALPGLVAPACLPEYGDPDKDHTFWNVERDGSCGWEVTTRVLQDERGLAEVVQGCAALEQAAEELGLKVNFRTGTHVHIGWMGRSVAQVKRALLLARAFEPALGSLVSPSRLVSFDGREYDAGSPNPYCQPLSTVFSSRRLARLGSLEDVYRVVSEHERRYVSLNIRPLQSIQTMEVRLHNGTLEAGKILLWLSLWEQILWAAERGQTPPESEDMGQIEPSGDVVALAHQYLPPAPEQFYRRLHERRLEVRELWSKTPALRRWLRHCDAWDPQYFPPSKPA